MHIHTTVNGFSISVFLSDSRLLSLGFTSDATEDDANAILLAIENTSAIQFDRCRFTDAIDILMVEITEPLDNSLSFMY